MTTPGLSSRASAHAVLMRVFRQRQTVEQAMTAESRALSALSAPDRGFCYQLVMTTLRWHGACGALLSGYLQTPLKDSRLDIILCLHLGVVQLLVLKSPPHAVVDTAVQLAKGCHAPLSGLVNAVLKKIAAEAPELDPLRTAPDWLWQSWAAAYGESVAEAIVKAHLTEPPLDLTVKDPKGIPRWAEALGAEILPEGSLRLTDAPRDITALPGFAEGAWWVQEVAASLPVKMLGEVLGQRVLDLCAAPGGKTLQLAAAGAKVTAVDISAARLTRLRENLSRMQLEAEVVEASLLKWQPEQKFEAILLDAPCSATGTIRRHPEIPWLRTPEDIARLVQSQARMLERAMDWLTPGGRLVYAVCSLQPEEAPPALESRRTLPSEGMDGFYMVRFRR